MAYNNEHPLKKGDKVVFVGRDLYGRVNFYRVHTVRFRYKNGQVALEGYRSKFRVEPDSELGWRLIKPWDHFDHDVYYSPDGDPDLMGDYNEYLWMKHAAERLTKAIQHYQYCCKPDIKIVEMMMSLAEILRDEVTEARTKDPA